MSSFCKSYSHFFSKNTCELDVVLTRTVNNVTTNELVKLTMLRTTGPRFLPKSIHCTAVSVSYTLEVPHGAFIEYQKHTIFFFFFFFFVEK